MTLRMICSGVVVAMAATSPVFAQDVFHYRAEGIAEASQAGIRVMSVDPVTMGELVTGAPYSAEAITEVTQTLTDGNRIERRTSAIIVRNSDGLVRREQSGFAVGAFVTDNPQPIVTIADPKNGVQLTLDYAAKVAIRTRPKIMMTGDMPDAGAVTWSVEPMGPRTASVVAGPGGAFERGQRTAMPAPPPPGAQFEPPMVAFEVATAAAALIEESKSEVLEPRTIEGLRAEGTRTTLTIPAGAVGNTLPIEIVSERWFSPELNIVLMTRRSDPRFGETVYRLTNLVQSEPAPDLFKVPAGFRIENFKP